MRFVLGVCISVIQSQNILNVNVYSCSGGDLADGCRMFLERIGAFVYGMEGYNHSAITFI